MAGMSLVVMVLVVIVWCIRITVILRHWLMSVTNRIMEIEVVMIPMGMSLRMVTLAVMVLMITVPVCVVVM